MQPSKARSLHAQCTYQPGELSWSQRASRDIACFLRQNAFAARDPHAEIVLLSAAAMAWELRVGNASWAALSISELFRRLGIQHVYFADPALVVAHYELLHQFVPWLAQLGIIRPLTCDRLVDELEGAKAPLVENARHQLRMRRKALDRQGRWHEVLRTMTG